jgi:hypothetical protein
MVSFIIVLSSLEDQQSGRREQEQMHRAEQDAHGPLKFVNVNTLRNDEPEIERRLEPPAQKVGRRSH